MPLVLSTPEIALRLLLAVLAGAMLGANRGAHGHAAGLRTTILVGLAASVAMVQANALLGVGGKTTDSFATMDLMRLPLGILTGVGFIGGGSILRKGSLVTGVTTAATLWATTVVGLCFGGGQIGLGLAATALAALTLGAVKPLERRLPRERLAQLVVRADGPEAAPESLPPMVAPLGYEASFRRQARALDGRGLLLAYEVRWRCRGVPEYPADLLGRIAERFDVVSFETASEAGF